MAVQQPNLSLISYFCLISIIICVDSHQTDFAEFQISDLQKHIQRAAHKPVCVLFGVQGDRSVLETSLLELWNEQKQFYSYLDWEIGRFSTDKVQNVPWSPPEVTPSLRCYTGRATPSDYTGRHRTPAIHKWLIEAAQRYGERLTEASVDILGRSVLLHQLTLVAFPDTQHHYDMEGLLGEVQTAWGDVVKVLFVHPYSPHSSPLRDHLKISEVPCVVAIKKTDTPNEDLDIQKIFKAIEITPPHFDVFLTLHTSTMTKITKENFESVLLTKTKYYIPMLVVFYTRWSSAVLDHLRALETVREDFTESGVSLRYGTMEVNNSVSRIMEKWVLFGYTTKFPFTVLFYAKWVKTTVVGVDQILIADRPTFGTVVSELNKKNFILRTVSGDVYDAVLPWGHVDVTKVSELFEGPDGSMCTAHSSNRTDDTPRSKVKPAAKPRKTIEKKEPDWHELFGCEEIDRKLQRLGTLPLVTDSMWQEVVEISHAPLHPFNPGGKWQGERTKVAMVVFIMAECSSCQRNLPVFEDLQKAVRHIDGGSLYVMNCTSDPSTCETQDITGYPTIVAYRGLGWLHGDRCMSAASAMAAKYVRMDYHGVLLVDPIMEWFSKVTLEAITDIKLNDLHLDFTEKPVSLVATLLPKDSPYLPRIPGRRTDYFYPYECFRLACERLFGQVGCYVRHSRDVPAREYSEKGEDMVVTQVTMARRDGAEADIVQLGRSLRQTLEGDDTSSLHKFHTPHRYEIKPQQKCEDDHGYCTDLIVQFTTDHGRLPITHMTLEAFHTKNSLVFENDLPVVVVLAHPSNISEEADFYKTLTTVASDLYKEVVMVTVDVEQFPAWAGQFVPQGGRHKFKEYDDPSYYEYPKLCVVQWHDHEHAAFYPPVKDTLAKVMVTDVNDTQEAVKVINENDGEQQALFDESNILKFLKQYLQSPEKFILPTEHF